MPEDVHAACLELLGWQRLVPDPQQLSGQQRLTNSERRVYERG